jgi:hypothetical protein
MIAAAITPAATSISIANPSHFLSSSIEKRRIKRARGTSVFGFGRLLARSKSDSFSAG